MTTRIVSYAQNAEDVVLDRAFRDQAGGFYVDVGANDPTHDSVTRHFYDQGWTGVNIEPQASYFEALQTARPKDVNLNVGIGAQPGTLDFYLVPGAKAMSTFSPDHAKLVQEMGYRTERLTIEVRTLNDVFAEHVGERQVDFLKVDVEGFEDAVLDDFDWSRWRPRAVLVESPPEPAPWEKRMVEHGYARTLWDGINLFFVRDEDFGDLGSALSAPATIVLDRYDPWFYVEQLDRARDALAGLYEVYLARSLGEFGATGPDVGPAARALGNVLSRRPDVTSHFGTPPDCDLLGILHWAGQSDQRADEPHCEQLVPFQAVYAAQTTAGAPVTQRLAFFTRRARRRIGAGRNR
ncbi:MAG TPA: FkbM family methyltransferase [Jatrophihabitantaceae bacterium]